ncbi:MAG: hypothetical protein DI582_10830 [Azospirillum brasilense]|nr:MAG: hypothetical protein DI582_10830 [Azospirillum brasilense]
MIELTDNQRAIITEASKSKYGDIRELAALKKFAPPVRENIVKGMLKRELLTTDKDGKTFVSDKGYAAIGNPAAEEPPAQVKAKKKPEAKPTAPKKAATPAKDGDEKKSKQQKLIDLLQSKKGATVQEMVDATGWQKHSVHGAMAGILKNKLKYIITSEKDEKRGRVYKITGTKKD